MAGRDLEINEKTMLASVEQQIEAHAPRIGEHSVDCSCDTCRRRECARAVARTVLRAPLSEIEYLRSQVAGLQETIRSLRTAIADEREHAQALLGEPVK